MNLNMRRPTGTHLNYFEPVRSKGDFLYTMQCEGIPVAECKDGKFREWWMLTREDEVILMGSFGPGERPDWQPMADYARGRH